MMSTVVVCQKTLCWPRDVKRLLGTFRRCIRDCSNARVQGCRHEIVGLDLGGHRQVCGSDTQENSIDRDCVQENTKRRSKGSFNELYPLLNCSLQCHFSKRWRCLSRLWCRWVCRTKGNHWSWDTTTSAEHISKEQPRDLFTSNFPQRIVRIMAKTKLADRSRRVCTALKTLPTSGNLITWIWIVESSEASEEVNIVQHCSTIQIKMWEW